MKEIKKVYGPYLIKNPKSKIFGRKIVYIKYLDNTHKTMLLSRYMMEQKLGRDLLTSEHVDHIDGDKTNDIIENLQVLNILEHMKLDAKHVKKVEIVCARCGTKSLKRARDLDANSKKGRAGPFCGKSCSAKYSREVQLNRADKLPIQPRVEVSKRVYFRLKGEN